MSTTARAVPHQVGKELLVPNAAPVSSSTAQAGHGRQAAATGRADRADRAASTPSSTRARQPAAATRSCVAEGSAPQIACSSRRTLSATTTNRAAATTSHGRATQGRVARRGPARVSTRTMGTAMLSTTWPSTQETSGNALMPRASIRVGSMSSPQKLISERSRVNRLRSISAVIARPNAVPHSSRVGHPAPSRTLSSRINSVRPPYRGRKKTQAARLAQTSPVTSR